MEAVAVQPLGEPINMAMSRLHRQGSFGVHHYSTWFQLQGTAMVDNELLKECHRSLLLKMGMPLPGGPVAIPTLCLNIFPPHAVLLLAERWKTAAFTTSDVFYPPRRVWTRMSGLKHVQGMMEGFGGGVHSSSSRCVDGTR